MMRTQPIIRVFVYDTRNGGLKPRSEVIEMAGVPRIGETFHWDGDDGGFTVKHVMWTASGDYDVQIRGW